MGLSDTMCDCLGGDPATCAGFWDPIIDANMAVVDVIIEPCCALIAIGVDGELSVELTAAIAAFVLDFPGFDVPEIVAALGLPMLNGFDISGEIEIPDLDIHMAAARELAIGIIMIPAEIVLGWLADLPEPPAIPTFDMILELVLELGFEIDLTLATCVAEMMMIPFDAVAGVVEAIGTADAEGMVDAGICPGDDGEIDHGQLFQ